MIALGKPLSLLKDLSAYSAVKATTGRAHEGVINDQLFQLNKKRSRIEIFISKIAAKVFTTLHSISILLLTRTRKSD